MIIKNKFSSKTRILLTLVFLFYCFTIHAQKRYTIETSVQLVDALFAPYQELQPGDTLELEPGLRSLLILRNIHGTISQPIVIINGNGIVEINSNHYFGISIRQSSFLKLSGNGDDRFKYGIQILNIRGSGLSVGDYSSDFELEHIEIGNTLNAGLVAKTEPDCNFKRDEFTQYNTVIHHCYIHHCGNEGMYVGSSFFKGQQLSCNGIPTLVLPALLRNVTIYENIVEYAGWDGIQVSSAINTNIHDNQVLYDSQKQVEWQMTGIILGEGSTGKIWNNTIKNGEGAGIFTNGLGDIYIYDNIILNPGKNNFSPSSDYGIYADDKSSEDGLYFKIHNNLILNSRKQGIRLINNLSENSNQIANNIVLKENSTQGNNSMTSDFISVVGKSALVNTNFCSTSATQLCFADATNDNFRLLEDSRAIDAGTEIPNTDFTTDIYGEQRVQGNHTDIGPAESCWSRSVINASTISSSKDIAFPNPVESDSYFSIYFTNELPGEILFTRIDPLGTRSIILEKNFYENGKQITRLNARDLLTGINFIQISKPTSSSIVRVIKSETEN